MSGVTNSSSTTQDSVVGISPVVNAFSHIRWEVNSLSRLRLSPATDIPLLRSADAKPLEYTVLSDSNDAKIYSKVLLKLLSESVGTAGPSSKVSKLALDRELDEEEACFLLDQDPMGVVTHYAISKLWELLVVVMDRDAKKVSVQTTFYVDSEDAMVLFDEWRPLLRVLHLGGTGDAFAQRGAALCLARILSIGCPSMKSEATKSVDAQLNPVSYSSVEEPLQALISWIVSQLQSSASASLSLITPTLIYLVKSSEARNMFADSGGIGYLARHLRVGGKSLSKNSPKGSGASVQQLYELSFCLWTLTYECNTNPSVRAHFAREGVISALVELISIAPREKVVRVSLSSLRNLAVCSSDIVPDPNGGKAIDGSVFLTDMTACGLMKLIDNLKERQWTDPDIFDDVTTLHRLLHENHKEMSRWDVYKAEVESGHLTWSVLHSEKFVKENVKSFEGPNGDFSILKILVTLLSQDDEDVVAIACFDIGEFVRHYPSGRAIAKRLGAKDIVMKLINHENAEVAQQALSCISKILVQNWKFVA
uniref:ATPase V1 complex subunit H C-terminal domain-containing protein n=1 Tax=Leptocylindrus danicus TaxID=163516 RepID=A0A7S2KYT8_9STRA|mmetsp:Transcript_28480/g.41910  ORF Transcript_28480/g.41910 Transcript_28480/m.41910 type:complete len:537 (+) Transcript_28480:179-1789(+)